MANPRPNENRPRADPLFNRPSLLPAQGQDAIRKTVRAQGTPGEEAEEELLAVSLAAPSACGHQKAQVACAARLRGGVRTARHFHPLLGPGRTALAVVLRLETDQSGLPLQAESTF